MWASWAIIGYGAKYIRGIEQWHGISGAGLVDLFSMLNSLQDRMCSVVIRPTEGPHC